MALIKCNDCGKEFSDKAMACPNCGCPNEMMQVVKQMDYSIEKDVSKKKNIVPIVVGGIGVFVVILVILWIFIVNPRKQEEKKKSTYNEAISLLEKGKYDDGKELLDTITGYKDVDDIEQQIKYESCAFSAVNAVKSILKNPDSIAVYDITFYSGKESTDNQTKDTEEKESETIIDEEHPYIVMHIAAQNGFGGNTTSYCTCIYNKTDKKYKLDGYTHELDENELDKDDDEYIYYYFTCLMIKAYKEKGIECGSIDMDRFSTVIKNSNYSSVKIIE